MADEVAMVKKTMSNTGEYARRWDGLQRVEDRKDKDDNVVAVAGSTLELEPGESAVVMVPADFEDPWLKEAKVGAPKKEQPRRDASNQESQKEG